MAFLGQEEQLREYQDRFKYFYFVVAISLIILVARLVYLQILQGDTMRRYSEENRIKRVRVAAPRGMIFDRNRVLLIDNQPAFDLEITPQYLQSSKEKEKVIEQLGELIDKKPKEIEEILDKSRNQPAFLPVKIKTDLTRDEVAKLETWKIAMPGTSVKMEIQRTNVYKDIASHLLGYIGKIDPRERSRLRKKGQDYQLGDNIGKVGIEKRLENVLRGQDGQEVVEVDALGRRIRERNSPGVISKSKNRPVLPGKNLILTIDQDLQLAAVKAFGDQAGGLVAINPKNGEILAMVSRPSFDPTQFSRGISPSLWKSLLNNPHRPLRDKTIQDHYPPGSVFKVVTAITALEEKVITPNTVFQCNGFIKVGRRRYHCHKGGGHGAVNVISALAESCDVFFYRAAQKLKSVDQLAKWAKSLGLGKYSEIDLAREVPGLVPTEDWKMKRFKTPWTPGELLSVAIGQSFVLSTPIQLANLLATIANHGTTYRPYYIKSIESPDGGLIQEFQPQVISETKMSPQTIQYVIEGLHQAVNSRKGTAFWQRLPGMGFVGKTGTSQIIRLSADKIYQKCENLKYQHRHHGLFAGFAPMDDPSIAVAVIAEHSCHGSTGAAPVARAVIETYLKKKFPEKYSDEFLSSAFKKDRAELKIELERRRQTQGSDAESNEESQDNPPPQEDEET